MEQLKDFFENFFSTGDWPPRWYCGKWSEFHGWLYIISDFLIFAAYFTIPFLLIHFIIRKKNVPFPKVFWLFGAFIFACGATHLIDAIIFWYPAYKLSAIIRLVTAIVSWATIIALYRVLPSAFSLKTPAELEKIVDQRTEELRISIERSKFIADAMPQIVWTATPDGKVDYVNTQVTKYSGIPQSDLLQWGWLDLLHPDDAPAFERDWKTALNSLQGFEMESRLRNHEGQYRWFLTRALPHADEQGNILLWVATATEIEEHKRLAETLEQKVVERTEQLRHANDLLMRSNNDLESFASVASHDLQAPLRTIMTYMSMLEEKCGPSLDESGRRFIGRSMEVGARMRLLIENLLTYARLNSDPMRASKIDLNQILEAVSANLNEQLQQRQAEVVWGNLPTINADGTQLQQLLQNLIANGIHYNDNAVPRVGVSYRHLPGFHELTIKDNGVGIPADYLEKVFEVFVRLDAARKGTGLGLAICKRIVHNHGGSISATSEIGAGTTFVFTIQDNLQIPQNMGEN